MPAVRLTQEEQQQGDIKQQVFVLVRALDFIEKAYNQDKIEESVYESQVERHLAKYQRIKAQLEDFELDSFMREYQLGECCWGAHRLKEGAPQQSQDNTRLIANITTTFHMAIDLCQFHKSKPQVSIIKPNLEDLLLYLRKASGILGPGFEPVGLL